MRLANSNAMRFTWSYFTTLLGSRIVGKMIVLKMAFNLGYMCFEKIPRSQPLRPQWWIILCWRGHPLGKWQNARIRRLWRFSLSLSLFGECNDRPLTLLHDAILEHFKASNLLRHFNTHANIDKICPKGTEFWKHKLNKYFEVLGDSCWDSDTCII